MFSRFATTIVINKIVHQIFLKNIIITSILSFLISLLDSCSVRDDDNSRALSFVLLRVTRQILVFTKLFEIF